MLLRVIQAVGIFQCGSEREDLAKRAMLADLPNTPEFSVLVFSFLLNLAWEYWQVPFFRGMADQATLAGRESLHAGNFGRLRDRAVRVLGHRDFREGQGLDLAAEQIGYCDLSRRRCRSDDPLRGVGHRNARTLDLQRRHAAPAGHRNRPAAVAAMAGHPATGTLVRSPAITSGYREQSDGKET